MEIAPGKVVHTFLKGRRQAADGISDRKVLHVTSALAWPDSAEPRRAPLQTAVTTPDLGAPERALERVVTDDLLATRLRSAIRRCLLSVSYQPLVELPSGRVVGAEALVRWTDADLGAIGPDLFIPIAERTGLINDLGDWVLNEACAEAAGWPADDSGRLASVSVNISPVQLADPDIVPLVQRALTRSGLAAERLCLEVTETAAIDDLEQCAERLEQLKKLGVRLALDDYGTGHSSLTMLRRLPVDVVKIDRSFVEQVTTSALDAVLVRLVIDTAHSFGLRVCAEGIETAEQARQLVAMGADRAQGWFFGRPQPASPALTGLMGSRGAHVEIDESSAPTLLLGGNDELIVVASLDYQIRYISASCRAILGFGPGEALGQSVLGFLAGSRKQAELPTSRPSGPVGNGQYRVRHKDGSTRWLQSQAQVISDTDGADQEILFIARDVTAEVTARRALAESEAKFREAFDGAPIGMAINRLDGTFLDVNQALAELLGYSTEQMLRLSVADLTHPDDRAADIRNTDALITADVAQVSVDKRYLHADGSALPVRVRASIVTDESGNAYIVAHITPRRA